MITFPVNLSLSESSYAAMMKRANGLSVEQMVNNIVSEWCAPYAASDQQAQREALIPVADEILAASPDKQQAAIAAALNAVRS